MGVVTGFDGCNVIGTTWSVEAGRLVLGDETSSTGSWCAYLEGVTSPMVPLAVPRVEMIDGTVAMLLGRGEAISEARRTADLPEPASLEGTTWILALDGADIALTFAEQLTVNDDTGMCSRSEYRYEAGSLVISAFDGNAGSRDASLLRSLEGLPLEVVQDTDDYSSSILLTTPTAGTVRLFPAPSTTTEEQATEPSVATPTTTLPTPSISTAAGLGE